MLRQFEMSILQWSVLRWSVKRGVIPSEEGCPRHQENDAKPPLLTRDGPSYKTDRPIHPLNDERTGQNSSRSANWIWRSGGKVSLMTPAEPAKLLPWKTIIWGNRKFA